MTIYYIPPYDGFSKVTAFAPVCLSIPSSYPRPHDLISLTATGLPYACWGRGAAPERGPAEAALPPLLHRRLADPLRRRALRRRDGYGHRRAAPSDLRWRHPRHYYFPDVRQHSPPSLSLYSTLKRQYSGLRTLKSRTLLTFFGPCSCWDGKNLDSPDHKSHVAYPASGSFESSGPCPGSHPVKLPQVMYEVMWDTREFNDPDIWPEDGSQPFVYSMDDS